MIIVTTLSIGQSFYQLLNIITVKPAHVVTSIQQSPVLKGHLLGESSSIFVNLDSGIGKYLPKAIYRYGG